MPKLGALTNISKQAVERAENFTESGRNRLRGGPPLTRSEGCMDGAASG